MPDSSGRLTPEEKETVRQWIDSNWTGSDFCPISGHNDWIIVDHIVRPIAGSTLLSGSNYPQVMLVCQGCGYTIYFNAVLMGLVPGGG